MIRLTFLKYRTAQVVATFVLATLCCQQPRICNSSEAKVTTPEKAELKTLLQAVIDHRDLKPYYHVDELPERKPLRVAKTPPLASEPELEKFGVAVVYEDPDALKSSDKPYMEFTRILVNTDLAHVAFVYPVEGIRGSAFFVRNQDGWKLEALRVVEFE